MMRGYVVWIVVATGCGPQALEDASGEGVASSDGSTLATTASETSDVGETTVPTSTQPMGDTSTSTSTSTTDGTTESTGEQPPFSVCDPQPESITADIVIDG